MRLHLDAPGLLLLLSVYATIPRARPFAAATLVNVTIDDTFGDESNGNKISYQPESAWNVGQDCPACTAKPDVSQVFNGSWHDTTFNGSSNTPLIAEVAYWTTSQKSVPGVAVYVYCILSDTLQFPFGNSDMTFLLDGEQVGRFVRPAPGDTTYHYNVPVYVNESLPAGEHTITIVNGESNGNRSLILLDYIVYSYQMDPTMVPSDSSAPAQSVGASESSSTSAVPSSPPLGASSSNSNQKRTIIIAVATVCGVLGLAAIIIVGACCCFRKRQRNYNAPSERDVIPRSPSHIEVNPATSGWAEGTWAAGDEEQPHSSLATSPSTQRGGPLFVGARKASGKRNRGGSESRATTSPETSSAALPSSRGPIIPPAILHGIPSFRIAPSQMSQSRVEPPGSPASSSWGTPANMAPPDSSTYLVTPATYSDTGGSESSLHGHNAHPFAKAVAPPVPLVRSRSDTTKSAPGVTRKPPPSAMPAPYVPDARSNSVTKIAPSIPSTSGTTSPTTPASAPYTIDSDESFLPSPSPADPSPISFASNRIPERQRLRPSASQRRRRVDPVDPSLQPPRGTLAGGERAPRGARALPPTPAAVQGLVRNESRSRLVGVPRERRRQGFLDVPVDAADSRPPSYREDG
ncbi:hypothetical protein C8Q79DRAFT_899452 [Trametes meyenii]|nr:hypothetical protein C8Q79DRAFT_899452 [Trametes meyenii]